MTDFVVGVGARHADGATYDMLAARLAQAASIENTDRLTQHGVKLGCLGQAWLMARQPEPPAS